MRSAGFIAVILSMTAAPAFSDQTVFESEEAPATLLELFTSEGCSSCPPAEAWLSKLKASGGLWKRVVPAAFHVDYWNGLGWADRFATAPNTARQQRYSASWHSNSVYTPGFVLNGREWRGWFEREALPEPSSGKAGKLVLTVHDGEAGISFKPSGVMPKALQVEMALLGFDLESDVKRGENSGRKLRHDFVVLHFASAPMRAAGDRFTGTVPLSAKTSDPPKAVAAWVTAGDAQPPIQATGGWLPSR